jgi:hypothetical protein
MFKKRGNSPASVSIAERFVPKQRFRKIGADRILLFENIDKKIDRCTIGVFRAQSGDHRVSLSHSVVDDRLIGFFVSGAFDQEKGSRTNTNPPKSAHSLLGGCKLYPFFLHRSSFLQTVFATKSRCLPTTNGECVVIIIWVFFVFKTETKASTRSCCQATCKETSGSSRR